MNRRAPGGARFCRAGLPDGPGVNAHWRYRIADSPSVAPSSLPYVARLQAHAPYFPAWRGSRAGAPRPSHQPCLSLARTNRADGLEVTGGGKWVVAVMTSVSAGCDSAPHPADELAFLGADRRRVDGRGVQARVAEHGGQGGQRHPGRDGGDAVAVAKASRAGLGAFDAGASHELAHLAVRGLAGMVHSNAFAPRGLAWARRRRCTKSSSWMRSSGTGTALQCVRRRFSVAIRIRVGGGSSGSDTLPQWR